MKILSLDYHVFCVVIKIFSLHFKAVILLYNFRLSKAFSLPLYCSFLVGKWRLVPGLPAASSPAPAGGQPRLQLLKGRCYHLISNHKFKIINARKRLIDPQQQIILNKTCILIRGGRTKFQRVDAKQPYFLKGVDKTNLDL